MSAPGLVSGVVPMTTEPRMLPLVAVARESEEGQAPEQGGRR